MAKPQNVNLIITAAVSLDGKIIRPDPEKVVSVPYNEARELLERSRATLADDLDQANDPDSDHDQLVKAAKAEVGKAQKALNKAEGTDKANDARAALLAAQEALADLQN